MTASKNGINIRARDIDELIIMARGEQLLSNSTDTILDKQRSLQSMLTMLTIKILIVMENNNLDFEAILLTEYLRLKQLLKRPIK